MRFRGRGRCAATDLARRPGERSSVVAMRRSAGHGSVPAGWSRPEAAGRGNAVATTILIRAAPHPGRCQASATPWCWWGRSQSCAKHHLPIRPSGRRHTAPDAPPPGRQGVGSGPAPAPGGAGDHMPHHRHDPALSYRLHPAPGCRAGVAMEFLVSTWRASGSRCPARTSLRDVRRQLVPAGIARPPLPPPGEGRRARGRPIPRW